MTEPTTTWVAVDAPHARRLLTQMIRIRRFEETCAQVYGQGHIRGFLHLYIGEEAIAAGAMAALGPDDAVLATYREHGHALARGMSMNAAMAEMYGKVDGCARGRGGSMHLFDASLRFYGGNAIVGGHLPVAVGLGLADRMAGRPHVTACFFGEGAMAEGEFHEAMNLAALWKLPVVFCCENNLYAMGSAIEITESNVDLTAKAASYGVHAEAVDGMDVLACEAAMRRAVARARAGGPVFLEFRTYRFRAHSMFDAQLYREKAEIERWKERDPIATFAARMREAGFVDDAALAAIEAEVAAEVAASVAFAEASPVEPVEDLLRDVTTPVTTPPAPPPARPAQPETMSAREAFKKAIREAMAADPRVFLMGEDVGHYGGCYAVTKGLLAEVGPERLRDTPLSESGFVGAGIGAALGGMRPIVEIMTVNFSLLALDQILHNAATLRHMSGGQLSVPLVIRMATGAGRQLAAQHSHSLENWFASIPGIRVVAPATVADARGMLWSALQDPDPVVIFENVNFYNEEGEVPASLGAVPLDGAAVRRAGADVTLVTYGSSLPRTMEAAAALSAEGIDAEVIDLRSLRPLDDATIVASIHKTRRAVIVDEGYRTGSLAGEVAARIQEAAFYELDAPIQRVCTAEVPIPYAKHLETAALPSVDAIVAAARTACHREVPRG